MLAEAPTDPFRALSDATRRVILEELADRGEQTLYELCARLVMKHGIDMSRQAVRKHLTTLEDAGFVATRQKGKFNVVSFTGDDHLSTVQDWLGQIRSKRP